MADLASSRDVGLGWTEMAYASAKEVESALLLAHDIIPDELYDDLAAQTDEVARLCYGLTRASDCTRRFRTSAVPPEPTSDS